MSAPTVCQNPACTCSPCSCGAECQCGQGGTACANPACACSSCTCGPGCSCGTG